VILNAMKIRLSHLRRIIRESLEEQGWPPGRWYPDSAEPVDDDEVSLMGTGGLGRGEKELEEARIFELMLLEGGDSLKKSSYDVIQKKWPRFAQYLSAKYGDDVLQKSSFAVKGSGLMSKGIPLAAIEDRRLSYPTVLWQDDKPVFNMSPTYSQMVRDAE